MVAGGEKQQEREKKGKEQRHQKIQRKRYMGESGRKTDQESHIRGEERAEKTGQREGWQ